MKLTVDTHIRIETSNQRVKDYLMSHLTKKNPTYQKLIQMGKPTGDEPKFYNMYFEDDKGRFCIPRGTGRLARSIGRMYGDIVTDVSDLRTSGASIDVEMNFNETFKSFYPYQNSFIKSMLASFSGVGVAGCGAGKSVCALGIIAELKQPTLIVVHTKELLHQWLNEIKTKTNGAFTVGQIGDGVRKLGEVTVALVQSLTKLRDSDWAKVNKMIGIAIFDETHRAPAKSYLRILEHLTCKRLYGLSATPKRKDGKHFLLFNYIGPVIAEIADSELQTAGRLVNCRVEFVDSGFEVNFDRINQDWIVMNKMIAKSSSRNRKIVENVLLDREEGRFPIVLVNRVNHAWALAEALRHEGLRAGVIIGSVEKEERKQTMVDAKKGILDVLVCNNQIAGEGLDVPTLSSVHLVFPINNEGKLKQFVGRARRQLEGKEEAVVWDYVDYFYKERMGQKIKHFKGNGLAGNRKNWYLKWGFNVSNYSKNQKLLKILDNKI